MKATQFIKEVKEVCLKNNVKIELVHEEQVMSGGISCSGYFVDTAGNPILSVATKKPEQEWLEILVHEYNHMQQYLDKSEVWNNLKIEGQVVQQSDLFDLWLSNQIELNELQLHKCVQSLIDVELDCEKRSVETIKKHDLPIDPLNYTQRANSYVLFYHLVKRFRVWSKPGKAPYMIKEVVDQMPNHFNIDYNNPPEELLNIIEQHCIKFY